MDQRQRMFRDDESGRSGTPHTPCHEQRLRPEGRLWQMLRYVAAVVGAAIASTAIATTAQAASPISIVGTWRGGVVFFGPDGGMAEPNRPYANPEFLVLRVSPGARAATATWTGGAWLGSTGSCIAPYSVRAPDARTGTYVAISTSNSGRCTNVRVTARIFPVNKHMIVITARNSAGYRWRGVLLKR